jgi:hypothetical protein
MRRRILAAALGCATVVGLLSSGSAGAAVTVGNGCVANTLTGTFTMVSLADDPSDAFQYPVPGNGVITGWSVRNVVTEFTPTQQLKVFRRAGTAKELTVVGESGFEEIGLGPNSFPTRIAVGPGDLLGLAGVFIGAGQSFSGSLLCRETKIGDVLDGVEGNPPVGATVPVTYEETEFASPVTVTVEPDADGDGFGDETQDACPTDASTQGLCPTAPAPNASAGSGGPAASGSMASAPPILTATGVAKKRSVVVTVDATAQARVALAGTVRLENSGTVRVKGGAQTVVPGTPATFVVRFPAKMVKALKHQAPGSKYYVRLTASAPGATPVKIVVKVHGQERRPEQHHLM